MDGFVAANEYIRVTDRRTGRFDEAFSAISELEQNMRLALFEGEALREFLVSMRAFGHEMLKLEMARTKQKTQLVRDGDQIKEIPFEDFFQERTELIRKRFREKYLPPVVKILDRVKSKKRGEVGTLHQKILDVLRMGSWGPNGLFSFAAIVEPKPGDKRVEFLAYRHNVWNVQ